MAETTGISWTDATFNPWIGCEAISPGCKNLHNRKENDMGWASGSSLFSEVIKAAKKHIPDEKAREAFYKPVIKAFEDHDWDTQNECDGEDPAFDSVMKKLHPEWYEDE